MRVVYRASFGLGSPDLSTPQLDQVADECLRWVFERPGMTRPAAVAKSPIQRLDRTEIGQGATYESTSAEDGEILYWALRYTHPDSELEGMQWQSEILLRSKDGIVQHFTCINRFGSAGDSILPARKSPSRPRIVRDMLQKYGGTAGLPLCSSSTPLNAGESLKFVDTLTNPARKRPIVLVTARNFDDKPLIDAGPFASWLCGLAHVYVATDRFPSLRLKDLLSQRLNCWDGAVRVYWPGFKIGDDPFRHRLWLPDQIKELESFFEQGFKAYVLGYVGEASAYSATPESLSWETIETIHRRSVMKELKDKGEIVELFELADEEGRMLRAEKQRLEGELRQLSEELKNAQHRERTWRQAFIQVRRGGPEDAENEGFLLPIESVDEAVKRAQKSFPQLIFSPNGQSDIEANPFEAAEEVYASLEWLATQYANARTGEVPCSDFDGSIRNACGWWYRGHQSEITMTTYSDWYTAQWEGRTYWLKEHIGTGSGKDARHTIRIAFDWDRDHKKVVIGFVGQHQKTDAT